MQDRTSVTLQRDNISSIDSSPKVVVCIYTAAYVYVYLYRVERDNLDFREYLCLVGYYVYNSSGFSHRRITSLATNHISRALAQHIYVE